MTATYLDLDCLDVFEAPQKGAKRRARLFWGDQVAITGYRSGWSKLRIGKDETVFARGKVPVRKEALLKVYFIDVGQGDAALVETPDNKRLLIDAGEEKFLARYLAKKFSDEGHVHFDAIVITHGDADHFAGLPILVAADQNARKPVVVTADRVLHNGLVKLGKAKEAEKFGKTRSRAGQKYVIDLFDDPRAIAKRRGNRPFRRWAQALDELERRNRKLEIRRAHADMANPLAALSKTTDFAVLGPITQKVGAVAALPFLRVNGSYSSSHTINGNSVVLKVSHGPWRFLFSGDLNRESEEVLLRRHGQSLRSEVLKVPHHGSADFGDEFLAMVAPLVSVVSTGSTSRRTEYLHPRANLMAALGAAGRRSAPESKGAHPIVFVTRLAGAFEYQGPAIALQLDRDHQPRVLNGKLVPDADRPWFYALTRENYGIVHVRCDKERMLVVRRGSRAETEPYAFRFENGCYVDDPVRD
jgi:beta-lactamase superfamily II metal-dependent hydrolase